jgi:hypothetical protein
MRVISAESYVRLRAVGPNFLLFRFWQGFRGR